MTLVDRDRRHRWAETCERLADVMGLAMNNDATDLREIAASLRAPVDDGVSEEERAWLLEMWRMPGDTGAPMYFYPIPFRQGYGWTVTPDPNKALRFARSEDAELVRAAHFGDDAPTRIREHIWTDGLRGQP